MKFNREESVLSPSIKVLGIYAPKLNPDRYTAFLESEIASRDPAGYSDSEIDSLRSFGRDVSPLSAEDKDELRSHLEREFGNAVLVEVVVTNPSIDFNVGDFVQPNPTLARDLWQTAWDERYLTADGTALLTEEPSERCEQSQSLRMVFYIHYWQEKQPLDSSYGNLALPLVEPVPDRLWILAPYSLVD
jgi:hypothetical protein